MSQNTKNIEPFQEIHFNNQHFLWFFSFGISFLEFEIHHGFLDNRKVLRIFEFKNWWPYARLDTIDVKHSWNCSIDKIQSPTASWSIWFVSILHCHSPVQRLFWIDYHSKWLFLFCPFTAVLALLLVFWIQGITHVSKRSKMIVWKEKWTPKFGQWFMQWTTHVKRLKNSYHV